MADGKQWDHCYNFALELVIESSKIIEEAFEDHKNIETKAGEWDLVTQFDRKVEEILISGLTKEFPTHKFIGEETVSTTNTLPELTNDPTWIIDPIDGTTNFVHAFPHTCVSIGFAVNHILEIGIIYNPILKQLFTARKGQGAFLNGKRISTSKIEDVRKSLICIEASYATIEKVRNTILGRVEAFVAEAHGIRTLGSAALTLCYVAMGAADAYHTDHLMPWDVAAGVLIIQEAGGVVINTDGSEFNIMKPRVLAAANPKLAQQLVKMIKKADARTIPYANLLLLIPSFLSMIRRPVVFNLKSVRHFQSKNMVDVKALDKYFECAKELTLEAGKLIIEGINIDKKVEVKTRDWDLVTKYDCEVENVLINGLKKAFPSHKFIAEETSFLNNSVPDLTDDPTWIIDPIDGTTNFVHGYPQTCISVALAVNKQPQIGIIYNPSYNEFFSARKGQGAFLNEKRIQTSNITTLKKALVSSEPAFYRMRPSVKEIFQPRSEILAYEAQGTRICGSAALTLAHVAQGILDGFQCFDLKPWDVAAGIILVEEAGGYVGDPKGGPLVLPKADLIATANIQLATEMSKLIIEADLKTQRKHLKRT